MERLDQKIKKIVSQTIQKSILITLCVGVLKETNSQRFYILKIVLDIQKKLNSKMKNIFF